MATHRLLLLRHVASRSAPPLRGHRRRWAQVHDVRFLATHVSKDRILDKYRDKLDRKAAQEGHESIDSLKDAYKDQIANLRKQAAVPGATAPLDANPQSPASSFNQPSPSGPHPTPPTAPPSPSPSSFKTPPGVKTLSSFLDVDKTRTLPPTEIETLWRLRHASNPNSLCATIPRRTYDAIAATARRHPQFILPLPRTPPSGDAGEGAQGKETGEEGAAEIHFLQWTFPTPTTSTVLFTHLAEYKLRGEFSTPHTTVTHHLDLAEEKGLVLLQGSVVDGRGVSVEEGKWLVMCLQKFYGQAAEETPRRRLMEKFSEGDAEGFRVEELLEEAERMG
ncbi:MAG: hypothetical protein M1821_006463 [Bathelium mastoideum]|nr:MAG: hypothetical protein M1821_006463 [Bathelium mastoideum]